MSYGRGRKDGKWNPRAEVAKVNTFRPHGDPLRDQREAARRASSPAGGSSTPPAQPQSAAPVVGALRFRIEL